VAALGIDDPPPAEVSEQYFDVPVDLAEKMLNCHDLLTRRLPAERRRHGRP
jgi:hypothetical protein